MTIDSLADHLLRLVPELFKHRPELALVAVLAAVVVYLAVNKKGAPPPTTTVVVVVQQQCSDETRMIRPCGSRKRL
jgi:hypothetical protein